MRRQITAEKNIPQSCCPGHDNYPNETYSNRRSKKARSKGIKAEHQLVRTIQRDNLKREIRLLDINALE